MKLHQRVTHACRCATPLSCAQTVDVGRNRHETRTLAVFDARTSVVGTEWESYVACILRMERFTPIYNTKMRQWDARHEISFYLSNRSIDADKAIVVVRDHWGIENKFHYVRDVTMLEDTSRMRVKPGIFARFRSFAFNILRLNQRDTIAQDRYECALGGIPFLSKLIM